MKLKLCFALILSMITLHLSAQDEKTVTGTVTDTRNVPLPGAEVKVIDKENYAITDFDGKFSLQATAGDQVRVTYLGFQTQTFSITSENTYTFVLQDETSELDEVVVVGYGNQKRSDITGAIVSVDSEEITKQPANNAIQAVQGKVAGVNIIANDAPGATPTVLMRGLGTAEGGRSPLYIVDGQPLSDIRSINPNDIESIDFLKGASYANIYGIRAANGVILITTKRGKSGKPVFNFESYYGVRTILNQVEMANANQYVQYFNEESAYFEDGYSLQLNQPNDTDWYDELLDTGLINNNSFSVSGASDNIDYFLSYNLFQEEGILEGQKYQRGTIRSNNTYHLFDDRFRIIQNLNISYTDETPKPFSAFNNAYRQSPLVPVFYDNGLFGQSYVNEATGLVTFEGAPGERIGRLYPHGNPVADVFFEDTDINTTTLQGQIAAELDITDDLMLTTRFGATKFYSTNTSFNNNRARWLNADPRRTEAFFDEQRGDPDDDGVVSTEYANNTYQTTSIESFRWNLEGFLTYSKEFGKHNLSATAGISRENYQGGTLARYLVYDVRSEENLRQFGLTTSALFNDEVTGDKYQSTNLQSYFARAEYNFDQRYYLRAVVRRDGTSDFFTGDNNQFGSFPAFSAGWNLTNESFMENNGVLDNFKLFAGWGKLGNQDIPFNVQNISTGAGSRNTNYVFGPSQTLIIGAALGSPAQDLSWEVTREWEVGFDFALLDRRLSGTIDYYNRLNTNAILNVRPILNSEFSANFFDEAAEISNTGWEFLVNWNDNIGEEFTYSLSVNLSTNENRVQNVRPAYDGAIGGVLGIDNQTTKRLADNQPVFVWWMYEANGVWQTQEEIDNNPSIGGADPGHLRYVDQNNDGVIDDRDKKYFGSYIPTYNYGINLNAGYKNFDLSIQGFGVGGNKIYNGLSNVRLGGENITEETFNNRWTGPGSTNSDPGAYRDPKASSYYLEDGDYFRINNITLGYTLPQLSIINRTRIYVTLQNPFMFTDYSGFTPELNQNGDPQGTTGIELAAYPTNKTVIFGANIQL